MHLLTAERLACRRSDRLVFVDLSFAVERGGALLITGANGSGKSSLLRLIAGLIVPFAGRLAWHGDAEQPARLAYVGHADAIKATLTALQNLSFWAALADPREATARARLALDAFGIARLADIPGRYLSAGQRRRVALARLLAAPARLWLLDEPTVALDTDGIARLEKQIARHRDGGGAVAVATHAPIALPDADALRLDDHQPADTDPSW